MTISKTQTDEKLTFTLEGRLDTTTAPKLQDALIPAFGEAKSIELDFSGLTYVSSAGLRVLLMGEKTAKAKGGRQTLKGVSAGIMEVFEMTGFSGILNIE
jgi:anti-anti-sigma factor